MGRHRLQAPRSSPATIQRLAPSEGGFRRRVVFAGRQPHRSPPHNSLLSSSRSAATKDLLFVWREPKRPRAHPQLSPVILEERSDEGSAFRGWKPAASGRAPCASVSLIRCRQILFNSQQEH